MDSDLEAVLDELPDVPPWHALSVEGARRLEDELFSSDAAHDCTVRAFAIDGPGGELPVRSYRPAAGPLPTVVFYHGGGWTLGTLDSVEGVCTEVAERAGCLVLSVDYRLAPEHPFPAAVEDAWAAFEWADDHAESLGGDGTVAVGGTSAGGGLAAATALRARERDRSLAAQLLLYPMLDPGLDTDSCREHADAPLLTRADLAWFWEQYLDSGADRYNPLAAPLRAPALDGVAPPVVATAGHDPLRSEGVAYADRLADAGVDVEHHHAPSLCHGFCSLTDRVPAADEAVGETLAAFEARLT
ncbi:alpha/beta hydrolase [Natronomonas marina]|jgi:acetyl esterase|uniref:alpha/beta hydrolase n=1 Tax=Natronomonas marina TaxID=2961939 RepID=UPI0020C9FE07|nr:alpha/beta hydrolase [Natronomonas marina]